MFNQYKPKEKPKLLANNKRDSYLPLPDQSVFDRLNLPVIVRSKRQQELGKRYAEVELVRLEKAAEEKSRKVGVVRKRSGDDC